MKPALSAGRVQSVAVRLIVEREREIQAFKSEASYRVTAVFLVPDTDGKPVEMKAELARRLKTKKEAQKFLESCKAATFSIEDIVTRPVKKSPAAPFTTSTLQQEAARKLGFTVAQTMMVAQKLYESGLITYMRTDSVNLSEYATEGSKAAIAQMMGEQLCISPPLCYKNQGCSGSARSHSSYVYGKPDCRRIGAGKKAIRPDLEAYHSLTNGRRRIGENNVTIGISSGSDKFTATGEVIKFDGFLHVYQESYDDDNEQEDESHLLPPLKKGQILEHQGIIATERFTQRPPRYTEASLVRKLEELGIGRPSTYAPTISTIQQREYVEKGDKTGEERSFDILTLKDDQITDVKHTEVVGAEKSKLLPTDIGTVVNDFLTEYFPNILDYNFTANVEKQFDEIAEGDKKWTSIMKDFYKEFHPSVETTLATKTEHKVGERILGEEPKTGKTVSVKIGRFGPVVQIGTADDTDKPRFAQMKKGQSMETITLEEALDLFKLPRKVGEFEGKTVTIGTGRFGPYVYHDSKYVSLPKTYDPLEVTLDEAIELILAKREAEAKKHIKKFDEDPEMEILNGRYGPYITYKGSNYKIPKDVVPADLNYKTCLEIIKLQSEKAESAPKRGRYAKKK